MCRHHWMLVMQIRYANCWVMIDLHPESVADNQGRKCSSQEWEEFQIFSETDGGSKEF